MRKVSDLDYEQLVQIVESLQDLMYLDLDSRGAEYWDPDKDWNGADVCEHVAGLLAQYDLVPENSMCVEGGYEADAEN